MASSIKADKHDSERSQNLNRVRGRAVTPSGNKTNNRKICGFKSEPVCNIAFLCLIIKNNSGGIFFNEKPDLKISLTEYEIVQGVEQ